MMEYCIWIVEQMVYEQGLFEAIPRTEYVLVDGDYKPLLDDQGQQYRWSTMAEAERKTQEVIMIHTILPLFDEESPDIPSGWGIATYGPTEHYAYQVASDGIQIIDLKDEQGLDRVFVSRDEALTAIKVTIRE